MNVFRLFLCLAGLALFLLVRYSGSPGTNGTHPLSSAAPPPEPSLQLLEPPTPDAEPAWGTSSQTTPPAVERFQVQGQTITVISGPQGHFYQFSNTLGQTQNLPENKFQQMHPTLFQIVQAARSLPAPEASPAMGLRLRPNGQLR